MKIVALILSWVIGCAAAICGLVLLFSSPWGGGVLILASLLVLPPVRAFVYSRTAKRLTFGTRALLVIALFVASMLLVTFSALHKASIQEAQQKTKEAQAKAAHIADVKQENQRYFATHRSEILKSVTQSISSQHYKQALAQAKKYLFVNDPKLNELYSNANKAVARKHQEEQAKRKFEAQKSTVAGIEQRITQNRQYLKKYYATAEQVKQAKLDIVQLVFIKTAYSKSKSSSELTLYQKASHLIPRVSEQSRVMYASALEEAFMKSGINATVRAIDGNKNHLRISYALMSKVLVYKFRNNIKLFKQAKPLGFTRIEYTNGFDGSLGETWTVKL